MKFKLKCINFHLNLNLKSNVVKVSPGGSWVPVGARVVCYHPHWLRVQKVEICPLTSLSHHLFIVYCIFYVNISSNSTLSSISWSIRNGFDCNLCNRYYYSKTIETRGCNPVFQLELHRIININS